MARPFFLHVCAVLVISVGFLPLVRGQSPGLELADAHSALLSNVGFVEAARLVREACLSYTQAEWHTEFSGAPSAPGLGLAYNSRYRQASQKLEIWSLESELIDENLQLLTPARATPGSEVYANPNIARAIELFWDNALIHAHNRVAWALENLYNPFDPGPPPRTRLSPGPGIDALRKIVDDAPRIDELSLEELEALLERPGVYDHFGELSMRASQTRVAIMDIQAAMCREADPTGLLREDLRLVREYLAEMLSILGASLL